MNWIFLAIVSAVTLGAYNFFLKVASGNINQIIGAVILQVVAAAVGGGILLVLKLSHAPLAITHKGVLFAVLAGFVVGLSEISTFFLFSRGVPASTGIPIIVGGAVVVGTALGAIFLKEALSPVHYVAVLFIVVGIFLLSSKY